MAQRERHQTSHKGQKHEVLAARICLEPRDADGEGESKRGKESFATRKEQPALDVNEERGQGHQNSGD